MTTTNVAPRTNTLAVVALVLSVVGFNVIAIVLGLVAITQVKKSGEKGHGLAVAAVVIGFVEILLGIILVVVAVTATQACVASGTCVVSSN